MITLDDVSEEFVVGGVFLRLFISQPNWVSCLFLSHTHNTNFQFVLLKEFNPILIETRLLSTRKNKFNSPSSHGMLVLTQRLVAFKK